MISLSLSLRLSQSAVSTSELEGAQVSVAQTPSSAHFLLTVVAGLCEEIDWLTRIKRCFWKSIEKVCVVCITAHTAHVSLSLTHTQFSLSDHPVLSSSTTLSLRLLLFVYSRRICNPLQRHCLLLGDMVCGYVLCVCVGGWVASGVR